MSRYDRGAEFERKVIAILEDQGYLAFRCAGSKGKNKVDVIALPQFVFSLPWTNLDGLADSIIDPHRTLLIQCKASGIVSHFEMEQLVNATERFGCVALLAYKDEHKKIRFKILCQRQPPKY